MTHVDIPADLNSEDEGGRVWTFRGEAADPSIIKPAEVVVAGSPMTPAACEVVDLVDRPVGKIVHLRSLTCVANRKWKRRPQSRVSSQGCAGVLQRWLGPRPMRAATVTG